MQIGLIGFGRLGQLLAKYLIQDADLVIYDNHDFHGEVEAIGAKWGDLKKVCQCPIIIPLVPISCFEQLMKDIAGLIKPQTLVADVCSVKSLPMQWMKEHLPKDVQILGTHPMFGPDSAAKTLFGSKIVLCPERVDNELYRNIKSYLEVHGLKVLESSAEEHDKQIAHSLLLTHFIGRTLIDFKAGPLEIDTKGYRRLMKILETVENDTWQLFQDMNRYNPYAKETRDEFIKSLAKIDQKVAD